MISFDGFCWFERLIINYTELISPNAEQMLWTMDIQLCGQYWCMMLTARSSKLRVIKVYPLFIASYDMMSAVEPTVHTWQDTVWHLLVSAPNVLAFELFVMLSNVSKQLWNQLQKILQVQLVHNMSLHEIISPNLHLQFFLVYQNIF